jgi:hypothetical protein
MKFSIRSGNLSRLVEFVGGLKEPSLTLDPVAAAEALTSDISTFDMLDVIKQLHARFGEEIKPSIVSRTPAGEMEFTAIVQNAIFGPDLYTTLRDERGEIIFRATYEETGSIFDEVRPRELRSSFYGKDPEDEPIKIEGSERLAEELTTIWRTRDDAAVVEYMTRQHRRILG